MEARNSALPDTLDPLLPQLAEGLLGERRQLARVCPGAQRTRKGSYGTNLLDRLLGQTTGLRGDVVESGSLHRVLETLEGDLLRLARQPLLDLLVAKLQQQVVQRNADRTRLPASAAEA